MRIRVTHSLGDLSDDMQDIARTAKRDMAVVVRSNANLGMRIGRDYARSSSGAHGKLYPRSFSTEAKTPLQWEYGPDASKKQGNMEFEFGSRNQPAHLDLNRSADVVGPKFGRDVRKLPDGWFW